MEGLGPGDASSGAGARVISVVANGAPRTLEDGATITSLLVSVGWRSEWVVVERNGEPVERARFPSVVLRDGDRLEIVRAVAGG